MSRVSDLENKVDALERNVGMLAKNASLDDALKIGDYTSISHYNAGIKDDSKGAFNISSANVALVVGRTPIYEYDRTAIYDLHIAGTLAYIWQSAMFVAGGVIRSMTVADIKKFFEDNPSFEKHLNIVQDINHMSDIYLIP